MDVIAKLGFKAKRIIKKALIEIVLTLVAFLIAGAIVAEGKDFLLYGLFILWLLGSLINLWPENKG